MVDEPKTWTRRLFVRDALAGWSMFVFGPGLYALMGRMLAGNRSSKVETVIAGPQNEFSPGTSRLVHLGNEKVLVVRGLDGAYHALGAECTHMGCSIRFEPGEVGKELACNCHNSRFDLNGENLSGPAPLPLSVFGVEVARGEVVVVRDPTWQRD